MFYSFYILLQRIAVYIYFRNEPEQTTRDLSLCLITDDKSREILLSREFQIHLFFLISGDI